MIWAFLGGAIAGGLAMLWFCAGVIRDVEQRAQAAEATAEAAQKGLRLAIGAKICDPPPNA